MSEESKSEEGTEKKEDTGPSLVSVLQKYPSAPSQEQIEQWKVTFGEMYVSGFSETELYIWRTLRRKDWIELQALAANPEAKVDDFKFQEMLCDRCLLWKSVEGSWMEGKAGTPVTLHEQILQNSNFMSSQAASMLVARL